MNLSFTEDRSIEQPAIKIFKEISYKIVNLYNEKFGKENPLGRETSSDVVLSNILSKQLNEINPNIDSDVIFSAIEELVKELVGRYPQLNKEFYKSKGELTDYTCVFINDKPVTSIGKKAADLKDGDEILFFVPVSGG